MKATGGSTTPAKARYYKGFDAVGLSSHLARLGDKFLAAGLQGKRVGIDNLHKGADAPGMRGSEKLKGPLLLLPQTRVGRPQTLHEPAGGVPDGRPRS